PDVRGRPVADLSTFEIPTIRTTLRLQSVMSMGLMVTRRLRATADSRYPGNAKVPMSTLAPALVNTAYMGPGLLDRTEYAGSDYLAPSPTGVYQPPKGVRYIPSLAELEFMERATRIARQTV